MKGFTVVEPAAIMATHLTEVLKNHASELLTRQDVNNMLDRVKRESPAAVEGVVPELLPLATVQKVLQNLLGERVSIRDAVTILETVADQGSQTKEPDVLSEYARLALRRSLVRDYVGSDGKLHVCTLDPKVEKLLADNVQATKQGLMLVLPPEQGEVLSQQVNRAVEQLGRQGMPQVLLTSPNVRLALRRYLAGAIPNLVVLSFSEITPDIEVYSQGTVSLDNAD
jgi:flagellar biosynthesis protein FlhA